MADKLGRMSGATDCIRERKEGRGRSPGVRAATRPEPRWREGRGDAAVEWQRSGAADPDTASGSLSPHSKIMPFTASACGNETVPMRHRDGRGDGAIHPVNFAGNYPDSNCSVIFAENYPDSNLSAIPHWAETDPVAGLQPPPEH